MKKPYTPRSIPIAALDWEALIPRIGPADLTDPAVLPDLREEADALDD